MNSMAQQAVPKGMGQMEDLRPHFTTASRVVVMTSPPAWTPGYVGSRNFPLKMSRRPMVSPVPASGDHTPTADRTSPGRTLPSAGPLRYPRSMDSETFVARLGEERASAIVRTDSQDAAARAMDAAVRGGFRIVE